jgi:hypothetical protein
VINADLRRDADVWELSVKLVAFGSLRSNLPHAKNDGLSGSKALENCPTLLVLGNQKNNLRNAWI